MLGEYTGAYQLLAGGTDLTVRLRKGHFTPKAVIDLKGLPDLRGDIQAHDGFWRVGALALLEDLIAAETMRRHFPALVEAAAWVGSVQIRNRATLVGNVCNASPAADTAPALLVYAGRVQILGAGGERSLPLAEFFNGPGRTALAAGEIVTALDLPAPAEPNGAAFLRLTRRRGFDLATVSVSCLLARSEAARFGFGAVASRPLLAVDDSRTLGDPQAPPEDRAAALQKLVSAATPISDVRASREYRSAMLLALSRKALNSAQERRQSNEAEHAH